MRRWRQQRRLSQLELSVQVGISTRHLSFVETGRSVPSRAMVLRLAEYLAVPLRERNRILLAAGHAPAYTESRLDAPALQAVMAAVRQILAAHEPFPALIVDRAWNVVDATSSIALFTGDAAPWLLEHPMNAYRIGLHPDGLVSRIVNAEQWRAHLLHRLRREAAITGDPLVEALYEEVSGYPGCSGKPEPAITGAGEPALPLLLRHGGEVLSFLSTVATFGTAVDITVAEISIEAFYPADRRTGEGLREIFGG
ncbi:helix-turn-helix domain-containing protein [Yinghuangia soli]|uniref:Helix-turn-helix transcriptional regulator n=1 Tax=Yinghuangia soli TaxID=2908204 RepID=A0AA41U282_9ACTN|nr:helix-turn-helix transcriptional regulator [Yinghuangia soli]MCF2531523.1 helix-turn-helix transcriptional regulator [Yinghuangia soli]